MRHKRAVHRAFMFTFMGEKIYVYIYILGSFCNLATLGSMMNGKWKLHGERTAIATCLLTTFLQSPFPYRATVAPHADPEIADQQRSSLATDGEAQVSVWTELVLVFLHLASDLDDATFTLLLPLLFPGSEELVRNQFTSH